MCKATLSEWEATIARLKDAAIPRNWVCTKCNQGIAAGETCPWCKKSRPIQLSESLLLELLDYIEGCETYVG